MNVAVWHEAKYVIGEGLLWNPDENTLYWVDIPSKCIYRRHIDSLHIERFPCEAQVACLGLCDDGRLIVGTDQGLAFWMPGEPLHFIGDPEVDKPGTRFNDGAVGPDGCFWAGTTSEDATARLYRFCIDGKIRAVVDGLTLSNGLDWSPDRATFYLTDTRRGLILAYDYAPGAISNRRVFVNVPQYQGKPDGLTVDAEGGVWSAHWGGSCVTRYTPDGRVDRVIAVPPQCPTSVAFGGPDLQTLFIASASITSQTGNAGSIFAVQPGVGGQPVYMFGT